MANANPPRGTRCQRNVGGPADGYMPCGNPAIAIMRFPTRVPGQDPVGYAMCSACAALSKWDRIEKGTLYQPVNIGVPAAQGDGGANALKADERLDPEEDIDVAEPASGDQLKRITDLAREQVRLLRRQEQLSKEMEEVTKLLNVNQMLDLPKAMSEADMEEFTLTGGYSISVDKFVNAAIPSVNARGIPKDEALRKNAEGIAYMDVQAPDLVKNVITITFDRKDDAFFRKFMGDLKKRKRPVKAELLRSVHASTLSKWVRERLDAGKPVDEEVLSVHRVTKAIVKAPDNVALVKG